MTPEEAYGARVSLDRERGRRDFHAFVRMAWPQIEPHPFVDSWHIGAVCEHLQALSAGQIMDLVISQPPGTSKSLLGSTLFPAWDWIGEPSRRVISSSYGQRLAEKNAKLHRDLVQSLWYRERWPGREIRTKDRKQVQYFQNEGLGWRFTTSVQGAATGEHGDLIIGDDLAKAQDVGGRNVVDPVALEAANNFWFNVLHTRRRNALTTRRLLIAQRLHAEDTPGKAIAAGYCALVLPMEYNPRRSVVTVLGFRDPRTTEGELLLPARFPQSVVDKDREVMGPKDYAAQFNQNPTQAEGQIFKKVGEKRWREVPTDARRIIVCDAAFKAKKSSDFVSIQVWAVKGTTFYLVANDTARRTFSQTCQALIRHKAANPGAGVYIEDKANGPAIVDTLKDMITGVVAWDPGSASKQSRAESRAHLFEAGNVLLPPDEQAPWIQDYIDELHRFPLVKHDDQADASTMALLILDGASTAKYAAFVAGLKGSL